MVSTETKHRRFTFEIPDTIGTSWEFVFDVTMVWTAPLQVVVYWRESSIGSGSFNVEDCAVTWKTLFQSWRYCKDIAMRHAYDWNKVEHLEQGHSDRSGTCNTRPKVIHK